MRDAVTLLARAYAFAAEKHAAQRRTCSGEPYVNHLAEVAESLAAATGGSDLELVVAGVLHDVIEDGGVTEDEVRRRFGAGVAALVAEVTDPQGLDEETRRRRQEEHAPHLSVRAKLLKIADKTSNIRERVAHPPDAPKDAVWAYVQWGERVVAGCRGLDAQLEQEFDAALAEARRMFGPPTERCGPPGD